MARVVVEGRLEWLGHVPVGLTAICEGCGAHVETEGRDASKVTQKSHRRNPARASRGWWISCPACNRDIFFLAPGEDESYDEPPHLKLGSTFAKDGDIRRCAACDDSISRSYRDVGHGALVRDSAGKSYIIHYNPMMSGGSCFALLARKLLGEGEEVVISEHSGRASVAHRYDIATTGV